MDIVIRTGCCFRYAVSSKTFVSVEIFYNITLIAIAFFVTINFPTIDCSRQLFGLRKELYSIALELATCYGKDDENHWKSRESHHQ